MNDAQSDIAGRCRKIFDSRDFIKRVYLFGSFARGEEKETSDIDFMVELMRPVGLAFFGLYDDLQDEFNKKIDVITYREAQQMQSENPSSTIMKDRIMIYER